MKIPREITTYCPKCNKHTLHKAKPYSKGREHTMGVGSRRHYRAIKGYAGSVEPKIHPKKVSKRQKAMLECVTCKYTVERVMGGRTKKKLEMNTV